MTIVSSLHTSGGADVVAAVPAGRLRDSLQDVGVEVLPLPAIPLRAGLAALDPRLRVAAARVAHARRHDLALVNLPSAQAGTSGLHTHLPTLAYLHIPHSLATAGFRGGAVRDRLAGRMLRRADRVVVPAPATRRHLIESWGFAEDEVGWVPPPARDPYSVSREPARAALRLPADGTLIGLVGRLSIKQKGHDVALRALRAPPLRDRRIELVFAGSGGDEQALRALAGSLGVADRVHFTGHVAESDAVYGALDALVIPSRFEGLPLVAIEALKLGLAGVASAVDGLCDVWPADWLVTPDRPDLLATALHHVLGTDPAARRAVMDARWRELRPQYADGTERMLQELRTTLAGNAPDR